MKKTLILVFAAGSILFLANCHPKTYPGKEKENTSMKPENATPNYTPEQIARGKVIFEQECGKCHDLPKPADHSLKSWNNILPKMFTKANMSVDNGTMVRAYVLSGIKSS